MLIVGGSGSEKINALHNLIHHVPDIDKIIYNYSKDPYEAIYQLFINKRESTIIKYLNDSKAFIEHQNDIDHIYKLLKNGIKRSIWT